MTARNIIFTVAGLGIIGVSVIIAVILCKLGDKNRKEGEGLLENLRNDD